MPVELTSPAPRPLRDLRTTSGLGTPSISCCHPSITSACRPAGTRLPPGPFPWAAVPSRWAWVEFEKRCATLFNTHEHVHVTAVSTDRDQARLSHSGKSFQAFYRLAVRISRKSLPMQPQTDLEDLA